MTKKESKESVDSSTNEEPGPMLSLFEEESPRPQPKPKPKPKPKPAASTAIATSHDHVPDFYSSGLVASWLGVGTTDSGHIALATPEKAAASAKSHSSNPVVLILSETPPGITTAIPWSEVNEVIFSSEKAAGEFSARPYANFDPTQLNITFDPALFSEPAENFSEKGTESESWFFANRVAGVIAAINQVVILANHSGASVLRDEITNNLLTIDVGESAQNDLLKILSPLLSEKEDDATLLSTLLSEVLALDPKKPLGGRTFIKSLTKTHAGFSEIVDSLCFAEKILLGKKELPDFSSQKGLRSSKALLLFLLREEPDEVLAWKDQIFNDPLSLILAAAFSGLRSGWKRFPTSLRTNPILTAKLQAKLANSCQEETGLIWGTNLPSLTGSTIYAFEDGRNDLLSLLADFEEKDWNSSLVVRSLREMGWEDLATTTVNVGKRNFHWDGGDLSLTIKGVAGFTWAISSEDFLQRVSNTPEAVLEPALKKLFDSLQKSPQ